MEPPPRRESEVVPLIVLLLLTIAVYWKIALTNQYTWANSPDLANQVFPWLQEEVRQWRTGHFPLWDPHQWGGQSLIAQMQPGVAYPLNWLLALAPLKNGHVRLEYLDWYFILIHYMGAAFCYLLCRDLGCSRPSSILAAVSFALCGFVGTITWPQMINGAIWTPLVFLFLLRACRGYRPWFSAAAAGSCLGIAFLGGHHQIPIFVALAVACTFGYFLASRKLPLVRSLALGVCFSFFTLMTAAVQVLPSQEYARLALRWVGTQNPVAWNDKVPYAAHTNLSFNPVALYGIIVPGGYSHLSPFVGITVLSLALIAIVVGWQSSHVRLFSLLAVFGIVFCLGWWSIFHGVAYAVLPLVDKARSISFAIFIFQFAVAILAAFGLDLLCAGFEARAFGSTLAKAVFAFSGFAYLILIAKSVLQPEKVYESTGLALAGLSALLFGAILLSWGAGHLSTPVLSTCLIALGLFEIENVTTAEYAHREDQWQFLNPLREHDDLAAFLRTNLGLARFDRKEADLPYNFGDWNNLDEYEGYAAGITTNIYRISSYANTRKLMGVRYYLSKTPRSQGQSPVFESQAGLKVFEEPDFFPRVWSVKRVTRVLHNAPLPEILGAASLDELKTTALITSDMPQLERCEGDDSVTVEHMYPREFVLTAEMHCRRMVVLGNTYFPGWIARVDGKNTAVHEVNGALQGIVVPSGTHRVEVVYRPGSVYVGAVLSLTSLLALFLFSIYNRREKY